MSASQNKETGGTGGARAEPRAPSLIKVLIVADVRLFAEVLAASLETNAIIAVTGVARNTEEALEHQEPEPPDVILVDMAMDESLAILRELSTQLEHANLVALALPNEEDVIPCAEAGIAGYLSREASLEDLKSAIDAAVRGEFCCSPKIARSLVDEVRRLSRAREIGPRLVDRLTNREVEILGHINEGESNREIARALCIEVSTVKNHVHNLLEKLQVPRRGAAVAAARPLLRRFQAHRKCSREAEQLG